VLQSFLGRQSKPFHDFEFPISVAPGQTRRRCLRAPCAGWPEWSKFRLLGDCLLFAGFLIMYSSYPNFWTTSFFNGKRQVLILTNNGLDYILGNFFTHLWSPCPCVCSTCCMSTQLLCVGFAVLCTEAGVLSNQFAHGQHRNRKTVKPFHNR
jgi:hypothetical protein